MLPTKKTAPTTNFEDIILLIYGRPKIGKSTWCAQCDHGLFLATEPGLNSLNTYEITINNWEDILNACSEIAKGEHKFKTIIIDTIDNAYQLCCDYICAKYSIEHQSDLGFGKGWALVNNEFKRVLLKLAQLNYGLFMVSHTKSKEIPTRTGTLYKIVPSLSDGARNIVMGLVDIILYCDTDIRGNEQIRVAHTEPSDTFEAGDRTGKLPPIIELNYKNFLEFWKK
jgi:hypothetical protein